MHAGGSGVRLNDGPDIKLHVFILVGWGRSFFVCFKYNSFKGFCTLEGAIDFTRKEDIDIVEEGDVLLRKPLSIVMPNHVSSDMTSNNKYGERCDTSCDVNDNGGVQENHPNNISERIPKAGNQTNQVA